MFCLGSKDGCSFYNYSVHILDRHIRLLSQLPAVFMLQSLVLDKFPVVLQLYNLLRHPLLTVSKGGKVPLLNFLNFCFDKFRTDMRLA